jgi:hypothetical protein
VSERFDLEAPPHEDEPRGWVFAAGLVAGWGVMAFGAWTVLERAGATRPIEFAAWFVALTAAHDLVVAPSVSALAGWLSPRIRRSVRSPVFGAAIVSAVLALLALPPLFGDPADNETVLVRNYPAGLAVALAVVWIVAAVWIGLARLRRRRSP